MKLADVSGMSEIMTWHVQPSEYKAQDSTKGIVYSNEHYHIMTTRVTIKQSNAKNKRLVTIVNEDWGHSLDGILPSPKEACTTQRSLHYSGDTGKNLRKALMSSSYST